MSLLRHNVVLLDQSAPIQVALVGRAYRIRPSDGDTVPDGQQRWWVVLDLTRDSEEGMVTASLSTSFDGLTWYPVGSVSTEHGAHVVEAVELPAFAPLVRIETTVDAVPPTYRLTARIASDGPFAAAPA